MDGFDYVIVGGGSAGAVLAARLSENERNKILLLEAGGAGRHPWVTIPLGYGKVFHDPRFNWRYTAEADPGVNGRRMYWPRGKVLGGSSAINAMVYVRGHRADYAEWEEAAAGWGWADVEPLFRRLEDWVGPEDPARGKGGPLTVTDMSDAMHPVSRAYIEAAAEAGFPVNPDYNAARMEGASYYQITTKDGFRASTATSYLNPARKRRNLRIETGALATSIRFKERRAVGVTYTQGGREHTVRAEREIILCGGAINTPQLLQLSGVGPGRDLQNKGIDVVQNAPQVGRNLIDHLGVDIQFASTRPSLNQTLRPFWGKVLSGIQYVLTRRGPLSMSLNQAGGFLNVNGGDGPPDYQMYFSPLTYNTAPTGKRPLLSPDPFPAFRLGFNACKPTSRGHILIRSTDPLEPPEMQPNYLSTDLDCRMAIDGMHLVRRIASMPALADWTDYETLPGAGMQKDEELLSYFRDNSSTVFHQCGTCKMGRAPADSVVDPRLRVHGVDGLRVADASIFPTIPSGNTNAPAVMVGEKASDLIIEDGSNVR